MTAAMPTLQDRVDTINRSGIRFECFGFPMRTQVNLVVSRGPESYVLHVNVPQPFDERQFTENLVAACEPLLERSAS